MTIRTFLAKGDWAGQAEIIEGLSTSTYQEEDGRVVDLATVFMRTYCHSCKKAGHISPAGYRLPSIAENGQEFALSGDINICDCNPAPVFYASRNMTATITSDDIARMRASYAAHQSPQHEYLREKAATTALQFDDRFVLCDAGGQPLLHAAYAIARKSGLFEYGETDGHGRTHLLSSVALAEHVQIYLAG